MRKLVILFFASVALLATGVAHAQTVLPRAGWVATGSSTNPGDVASDAIAGSSVSRWSSGTPQTSGGRLANEVAPPVPTKEPVAIILHQYAACSFVPTISAARARARTRPMSSTSSTTSTTTPTAARPSPSIRSACTSPIPSRD